MALSASIRLNEAGAAKVQRRMTAKGPEARVRAFFTPSDFRDLAMADDSSNIDVLNSTAQSQLKSIIERIERLEQEKSEVAEQIKELMAEAKGNGFDGKILRKVIRIRKQDRAQRQEEEAILDLYLSALGEI
jgi:uncharacterized protein (UPF0335 family)